MNTTKQFELDLYNQADSLAKKEIIKWLEKNNFININDKETMSFDIVCNKNKPEDGDDDAEFWQEDLKYFYEVEIKYSWKGEWPETWDEIRIPYRKSKLIDRWTNEFIYDNLIFVVFRNDCKQAWHIPGEVVANSDVREVSNRKVKEGEKFYHIKTKDAKLVKME